jgi:CBS domain containing-hemolysin-like protein
MLGAPPPELFRGDLSPLLWIAVALLLASIFATLRLALRHSVPERVLSRINEESKRDALQPLLERAGPLATSAGVLKLTADFVFAALVLEAFLDASGFTLPNALKALAIGVPSLLLATEAVPTAVAKRWGDGLLIHILRPFHVMQLPLRPVVIALEALQLALQRLFGLPDSTVDSRQIVESLREVIEDAEVSGGLDETERELIENVMEFRDVDVAAVMTPRTEIHGLEVDDDLLTVARKVTECGHSRMPVYEDSLDTILGTVSARDVVQVVAQDGLEAGTTLDLRAVLRPAYFVPETKHISELLAEFRHEKTKIAVVLDEYGGTAGLVTLADITGEIVGDVLDEFDEDEAPVFQRHEDGSVEIEASLHVSEVNEELDTGIPDTEDFETLGGFVLAELGHFPKQGESFERDGFAYTVTDASDRRVLRVRVLSVESPDRKALRTSA